MNTSKQRILSLILTLCFVIGLFPFSTFAIGTEEEEHVIAVPQEAMVITAGTYYGISKSWFEENNPHGEKLSLSIELPNSVTTICKDGFRDSWSSEKQKQGCIRIIITTAIKNIRTNMQWCKLIFRTLKTLLPSENRRR